MIQHSRELHTTIMEQHGIMQKEWSTKESGDVRITDRKEMPDKRFVFMRDQQVLR